jgi:beta-N-acetylhexosaminidase
MTANLRHAAGSLLVVGLAGTELTGLERAWLKLVRPAGIILFRRNIEDPRQTRALLHEAAASCSPHSLRCIDVEGGVVDRLRDALAPMPSPRAVMNAARQTGKLALICEHGELVARSVHAFGLNTTLAPVLDLALPASTNVMGTRSAAATPAAMVEYGRFFLAGLAARGVAGCGKHFPGLGGGTLDSHHDTPAIRRDMRQLNHEDLIPFQKLKDDLPMVMVNHAAYPKTPSGNRPASTSAYWITNVLRKRIGYRGLIFSDDLEMGGILKFMSIDEAAIAAIRAGMDMVEICHSPELILRAYESIIAEAERSQVFRRLVLARARQVFVKRRRLFSDKNPPALSVRQFDSLRARVLRFGEAISKAQPAQEIDA